MNVIEMLDALTALGRDDEAEDHYCIILSEMAKRGIPPEKALFMDVMKVSELMSSGPQLQGWDETAWGGGFANSFNQAKQPQ